MDQPVAAPDKAVLHVQLGAVQRMEHGANQLPGRAGIELGIAVEGEQIARSVQRVLFAKHPETALLIVQQPRQFQQSAALALPATPVFTIKAAGAGEAVKAAAVSAVQRFNPGFHPAQDRPVAGCSLAAVRRQIGQKTEEQVFPLASAGQTQLFQLLHQGPGLRLGGRHGCEHAKRSPLWRHSLAHIHARQAPGRDGVQQQIVDQVFHQLRHRQQQEQRGGGTAQGEGRKQGKKERQQHIGRDVEGLPERGRVPKQEKADVPALLRSPFHQPPGIDDLLHAFAAGQQLHPAEIVLLGLAVHAGVIPAGVTGEDGADLIGSAQKRLRVQHGEEPQRSEKCLQGGGERLRIRRKTQLTADGGHLLQQGGAQTGEKEGQLRPVQHRDTLYALQEESAARLRDLPLAGLYQRPAEGENPDAVLTASQMLGGTQRRQGGEPLTPGQIAVIQQPLTGSRNGGLLLPAAAHGLIAAVDLPETGFELLRRLHTADKCPRMQQPRCGDAKILQPFIVDVYSVHTCLPGVFLVAFPEFGSFIRDVMATVLW